MEMVTSVLVFSDLPSMWGKSSFCCREEDLLSEGGNVVGSALTRFIGTIGSSSDFFEAKDSDAVGTGDAACKVEASLAERICCGKWPVPATCCAGRAKGSAAA